MFRYSVSSAENPVIISLIVSLTVFFTTYQVLELYLSRSSPGSFSTGDLRTY
jgi:hypothetical protein